MIWFDESSTNLFQDLGRSWQPKKNGIVHKKPAVKTESVTILGGLTNEGELVTILAQTTNTQTVYEFCKELAARIDINGAVFICDNHKSHYSHLV